MSEESFYFSTAELLTLAAFILSGNLSWRRRNYYGKYRNVHASERSHLGTKCIRCHCSFRYIKLQNGLCALLISDLNYLDGAPSTLSSEEEEEEEEDDDDESEEESDEDDSGAEIEDGREGFDEDCDEGDEDDDDEEDNEDFNDPDDSELEELAEKEETRKRGCTEKQVCF